MNLINRLNRKFGKYAIHNLMLYVVIMYAAGVIIEIINPNFYQIYLSFNAKAILSGQVWRIFTFLIQAPSQISLFIIIELYMYYIIGNSLERAWGSFRFNLYYLTGILLNILVAFIVFFVTGYSFGIGLTYINRSLFLAFAALYPNMMVRVMFILPVKVKYLGFLYGAYVLYEVFISILLRQYISVFAILISIGNFLIYFFSTRNYKKVSPSEYRRKKKFRNAMKHSTTGGVVTPFPGKNIITRHKCSVCGRTELDDESLEFRFCSKCEGDYEYCSEHLYTHEHVKKI